MNKNHYYSIDWLRIIACVGIIMMHMQANNMYNLSGFIFDQMIPSFTNFVFLFMTISAFGMCCGYFDKVMSGKVNWTDFYKKRYVKILPFFTILVLVDLLVEFSEASLFEAVADISLMFGLFPNNITVIGVGWFLGLVFAFYFMFPFFCVLIENKRRAWLAFGASLIMNYICGSYFGVDRSNIVYSMPFFISGGLIYLYRDKIEKLKWYSCLPIVLGASVLYYVIGGGIYCCLLVANTLLVSAISIGGRYRKVFHFLSDISMEMYLAHMVVFRVVERLHINKLVRNGVVQYIITTSVVILCTMFVSWCWIVLHGCIRSWMVKRNERNMVN